MCVWERKPEADRKTGAKKLKQREKDRAIEEKEHNNIMRIEEIEQSNRMQMEWIEQPDRMWEKEWERGIWRYRMSMCVCVCECLCGYRCRCMNVYVSECVHCISVGLLYLWPLPSDLSTLTSQTSYTTHHHVSLLLQTFHFTLYYFSFKLSWLWDICYW